MVDICLVEDESDLNQMLKFYLEKENYTVYSCKYLYEAQNYLDKSIPIWIIDIMLTDGSGLDLLKEVKNKHPESKAIIISAKGDRFDRVTGFELGCDDYISKPFLPAELIFRVKKLKKDNYDLEKQYFIKPYTIDLSKRMIFLDGERIDITSREFDIIIYFIKNNGQALSREQILNNILGVEYYGNDRIVDNYIKNIRKKLPELSIETIYGYGYRYNL